MVSVEVTFFWPRPRSHMGVGGANLLDRIRNSFAKCFPSKKVDIDNLAKFVLDAMVGPVYFDDSQVVKLSLLKMHDNEGTCEGRTEVKITEIHTVEQLTL